MPHAPQHSRRKPSMPQTIGLGACPRCLQPDAPEAEGNERSVGMKPDGEAVATRWRETRGWRPGADRQSASEIAEEGSRTARTAPRSNA